LLTALGVLCMLSVGFAVARQNLRFLVVHLIRGFTLIYSTILRLFFL